MVRDIEVANKDHPRAEEMISVKIRGISLIYISYISRIHTRCKCTIIMMRPRYRYDLCTILNWWTADTEGTYAWWRFKMELFQLYYIMIDVDIPLLPFHISSISLLCSGPIRTQSQLRQYIQFSYSAHLFYIDIDRIISESYLSYLSYFCLGRFNIFYRSLKNDTTW